MAAKTDAVEKQATAAAKDNKSEGMRILLRDGRDVATVAKFFDAPYGFVYGVATRLADAGEIKLADVTSPREAKAAAPAKAPRSTAKSTATKAAPAKAASTAKAPARSATKSKTTAKRTAAKA